MLESQKFLIKMCGFDFNANKDRKEIHNELVQLYIKMKYMKKNKILPPNCRSIFELEELMEAITICAKFYSTNGYILEDMTIDKSMVDYSNLYHTKYFNNVICNKNINYEERVIMKNHFDIINQIYTESHSNSDITDNPVILNALRNDSSIIDMLYEIVKIEEDQEYLKRIKESIAICKESLINIDKNNRR